MFVTRSFRDLVSYSPTLIPTSRLYTWERQHYTPNDISKTINDLKFLTGSGLSLYGCPLFTNSVPVRLSTTLRPQPPTPSTRDPSHTLILVSEIPLVISFNGPPEEHRHYRYMLMRQIPFVSTSPFWDYSDHTSTVWRDERSYSFLRLPGPYHQRLMRLFEMNTDSTISLLLNTCPSPSSVSHPTGVCPSETYCITPYGYMSMRDLVIGLLY